MDPKGKKAVSAAKTGKEESTVVGATNVVSNDVVVNNEPTGQTVEAPVPVVNNTNGYIDFHLDVGDGATHVLATQEARKELVGLVRSNIDKRKLADILGFKKDLKEAPKVTAADVVKATSQMKAETDAAHAKYLADEKGIVPDDSAPEKVTCTFQFPGSGRFRCEGEFTPKSIRGRAGSFLLLKPQNFREDWLERAKALTASVGKGVDLGDKVLVAKCFHCHKFIENSPALSQIRLLTGGSTLGFLLGKVQDNADIVSRLSGLAAREPRPNRDERPRSRFSDGIRGGRGRK